MEQKLTQLQAKLETDNSLIEKLFNQETPEAVQDLLKAEGLDFSLEEIKVVRAALVKAVEKGNGELTDSDLEDVAGGIVVTTSVIATTFSVVGATASVGGLVNTLTRSRW